MPDHTATPWHAHGLHGCDCTCGWTSIGWHRARHAEDEWIAHRNDTETPVPWTDSCTPAGDR